MLGEKLEALYRIPGFYIYIQYLSDDPDGYIFDYTVFDEGYNDIDGGVIGTDQSWNLYRAATEIIQDMRDNGITRSQAPPWEINIEEYYEKMCV